MWGWCLAYFSHEVRGAAPGLASEPGKELLRGCRRVRGSETGEDGGAEASALKRALVGLGLHADEPDLNADVYRGEEWLQGGIDSSGSVPTWPALGSDEGGN